jgi:hypothetical protein
VDAFEAAVSCGVSPSEFWGLTPYLTKYAMDGARKHQLRGAWLTAALHRAKKMPKLEEMMTKMDGKPKGAAGLKDALLSTRRGK